jgi:hypothetical protein
MSETPNPGETGTVAMREWIKGLVVVFAVVGIPIVLLLAAFVATACGCATPASPAP